MKRILIINTIGFGFEGISSVIVNYLSHMDKHGLEFTFLAQPSIDAQFKAILESLGTVIVIPDRKQDTSGYIKGLNGILKRRKFDVIHIHGNSGTMAIEAFLARIHRVKRIIVHAHNTHSDHPVINRMLSPLMKALSTDLLACSVGAGKFLYRKGFTVLSNAIDVQRFSFQPQVRDECRKDLGLAENTFVIGHVGYFLEVKNQSFLVDVFAEYYQADRDARLLLVGTGPDLEKIKRKAAECGVADAVIFAGQRSDVERLYCAMDVFAFPSLWEGLPLTLVEAQVSGLPCIVSANVTKDVACTNNVIYKSVSDGAKLWAESIEKLKRDPSSRKNNLLAKALEEKGFDINRESSKLRVIYLEN